MNFIVEGIHLPRGLLALKCCKLADPFATINAVALAPPLCPDPDILCVSTTHFDTYSDAIEQLLARESDAVVVPSTIYGTIIANRFRKRHRILAEPYLTHPARLDKIELQNHQSALRAYFPATSIRPGLEGDLPLLAKPRVGHSSLGHIKLYSASDIAKFNQCDYLFEPLFPTGAREFSLTAVKSKARSAFRCIERIKQEHGATVRASSILPLDVAAAAGYIVERLRFETIYNLQFAWVDARPWIYDLNPRFGRSELYRTCFGFNFVAAFIGETKTPLTFQPELSEHDASNHLDVRIEEIISARRTIRKPGGSS